MKIGFMGLELPEGKVKYKDSTLIELEKKDKPKKVTPFFAEFIQDEFTHADVIVIPEDQILDLLILDIEKVENRISKCTEDFEKQLMEKCQENLENEIPLCDVTFTEEEHTLLKTTSILSYKPVLKVKDVPEVNSLIKLSLEKANLMFFYTSGPKESHAWLVNKESDIVTCAGKIHSDLARGFIRGDIVSFQDYMKCHNFNECKSKGLSKLVDRDYIVQPEEIIEIRFNV